MADPSSPADHDQVPGVDLDALRAWMDGEGLGEGPLEDVEQLAGGNQNVLVRFERAGRAYVLRRPPLHKRANSDETMRREARVLAALAGSDVPHPGLIASCGDVDVLGAAFYLMEPIDGFNPASGLPEPHRSDAAMRRELGFGMVDGIAALARVDHVAVGLGDFGKPDGWLERQVGRWRSQLDSYAEHEGYPGPDIPGVDRVSAWLDDHRPDGWRPGIIHGDFHLANVLVRPDAPELAAIVDWELCTIGDPLLDLGHLLARSGRTGRRSRRRRHPRPARRRGARRPLRRRHRALSGRRGLVPRARRLPARDHPRGHPRPGLRRQGPEGGRRPAARHHRRAVRAGPGRRRGLSEAPRTGVLMARTDG
jgi:aminoglycoside phosphotransferase (APT) family kinase protein